MSVLEPWQIEFPLPITTDRVTLHPCREGDGKALAQAIDESFDTLHPWFHDSMGPRETEVSPKWQEVVACRSLAQFKARERLQFLVWTTSETLVGSVELFDPDWARRAFRLAFWIRPSLTRQGLMTESCTALIRFAFAQLGANRITTGHAAPNVGSERLIRKLGFARLSAMPMGCALRDGTYVDGVSYVMTDLRQLAA